MRYARPSIEDALQTAREAKVQQLLSFSLYPQFSVTTTGSSENELNRALARMAWDIPVQRISRWSEDEGYIGCLVWRLKRAIRKIPPELQGETLVLYAAHGTPISFVRRGDPYLAELQACVQLVEAQAAHGLPHRLAFQSRVGPVTWTKPYLDKVLQALPQEGIRSVVIVPLSFVSDHVETLYELDIQMRTLAERVGIQSYLRAESLNADPDFLAVLASLAASALGAKVSS
jgi:ferrochelatase